jgi:aryl-alcohol dehydrogenase-like predicted oxidoreductase
MRFRTYKNTDLTVSEVGFGLWTISTGWWGNFTEGESIALMHKAFDPGITLFDAADPGDCQCLLACNRPFCERGIA